MRRLPALIATVLVAGAGLGAGGRAVAAVPPELQQLVILLRPAQIDELTREALARITGELAAARFRVIIFPLDPEVDPTLQVETVGRDLVPVAAFALVRGTDESAGSVAIWVSDRLAQRTTIQRMRVQDGDVSRAAEVLAVEAVEIIRVSMADLWPHPAPAPAPAASGVAATVERARAGVALGVGMLEDLRLTSSMWAPVLKLTYGRPGGFAARLAVSGLGPGVDLQETGLGGAHLQRQTAWLAVVKGFRPGRRVQPLLSGGGGIDRLRAQGSAVDPARTHDLRAWSAVVSLGAGLSVALAAHLALVVEAQAMMFLPPVRIQIGEMDVARFDLPSVLVDAGLRVSF